MSSPDKSSAPDPKRPRRPSDRAARQIVASAAPTVSDSNDEQLANSRDALPYRQPADDAQQLTTTESQRATYGVAHAGEAMIADDPIAEAPRRPATAPEVDQPSPRISQQPIEATRDGSSVAAGNAGSSEARDADRASQVPVAVVPTREAKTAARSGRSMADRRPQGETTPSVETGERGGGRPPRKRRRQEPEFEKMPKRRRGCTVVAALLVVFVLLVAVVPAGLYFMYESAGGNTPGTGNVAFTVAPGQGVSEVAQNLETAGVINSAQAFRVYVKVKRLNPLIQAGDYELREGMGAGAVISAFAKGPVQRFRTVTLAPGLTVADQSARVGEQLSLSSSEFLAALSSKAPQMTFPEATNPEGLCFPETYRVEEAMIEDDIAEVCLEQFNKIFKGIGQGRLAELKVTPYQAVIVASLVESEAKVPDERPVIASVIYNRLKQGMPLQIDATVLYALGRHKEKVLLEDLKVDSPYNTYRIKGLPPTPISAPGKSALEAALNPAQTNYIYYVLTDPAGRHAFTDSAKEFERLKADSIRRGVY